jgi:peptidoglycan/xylan/chitin deacetylase (PgdA/CDA1 family)
MGRVGQWLARHHGVTLDIMSWADARALAAGGFDIGAHSVSHPRLAAIAPAAAAGELRASKARIEDEIGVAVRHTAYPYGSHDPAVRAEARAAGYESACTTQIGLAGPGADRWALPRVPIDGRERAWDFAARLLSGYAVRDLVRRRLHHHEPGVPATRCG